MNIFSYTLEKKNIQTKRNLGGLLIDKKSKIALDVKIISHHMLIWNITFIISIGTPSSKYIYVIYFRFRMKEMVFITHATQPLFTTTKPSLAEQNYWNTPTHAQSSKILLHFINIYDWRSLNNSRVMFVLVLTHFFIGNS